MKFLAKALRYIGKQNFSSPEEKYKPGWPKAGHAGTAKWTPSGLTPPIASQARALTLRNGFSAGTLRSHQASSLTRLPWALLHLNEDEFRRAFRRGFSVALGDLGNVILAFRRCK